MNGRLASDSCFHIYIWHIGISWYNQNHYLSIYLSIFLSLHIAYHGYIGYLDQTTDKKEYPKVRFFWSGCCCCCLMFIVFFTFAFASSPFIRLCCWESNMMKIKWPSSYCRFFLPRYLQYYFSVSSSYVMFVCIKAVLIFHFSLLVVVHQWSFSNWWWFLSLLDKHTSMNGYGSSLCYI